MDNRRFDITGTDFNDIASIFQFCWPSPTDTASHYVIEKLITKTSYHGTPTTRHWTREVPSADGIPTLILMSCSSSHDCIQLPYGMNSSSAATLASGWLEQLAYPINYDPDLEVDEGFRIFLGCEPQKAGAIIAIQPVLISHGK